MTDPVGSHIEPHSKQSVSIPAPERSENDTSIISKRKKAILLAFEGIPGAGKSTQAEPIRDWIAKTYGKRVSITRAFGTSERTVIEVFQQKLAIEENSIPMMFAFQALHSRHFSSTIAALNENDVVITDCWRYPFIAFHSLYGQLAEMHPSFISMLDFLAYRNFNPDLTFHFCLDPNIAYSRYKKREANLTSPVRQETEFNLYEMADFYLQASKREGWMQIDANASPSNKVTNQLKSCLMDYFSSCSS